MSDAPHTFESSIIPWGSWKFVFLNTSTYLGSSQPLLGCQAECADWQGNHSHDLAVYQRESGTSTCWRPTSRWRCLYAKYLTLPQENWWTLHSHQECRLCAFHPHCHRTLDPWHHVMGPHHQQTHLQATSDA